MKKIIALLTLVLFLTSCAGAFAGDKLSIVATTFPQYDWLINILGGKASEYDVTLLVGSGSDIHNYQPTAKDIITISTCDMIIYVGGQSDMWVADALATAQNGSMRAVSMMASVEAREEELVAGMQSEEEEEAQGAEYDEHVWLSLRHAKTICAAIADELGRLDPENAAYFADNAKNYAEKLDALDGKYIETVKSAKRNTLLFADRFPFRYMTDDYGIEYFAAFAGCSAETEASFETIAFLAGKIDELGLTSVIVIDGGNHDLARTVVSCTKSADQKILEMNSIQSVADLEASYLSIMENNLSVLETALN